MNEFFCIRSAAFLPAEWDLLAANYFQKSRFLIHAEKYNPCQQRYYLLRQYGMLTSAAVMYTLQLDLLTFLRIKSPLKMHIVGIPCSVSSSGIFGNTEAMELLKQHIFSMEKGFVLFLNLEAKPIAGKYAIGNTLPGIIIPKPFQSWEHYLSSFRSAYRRRLRLIDLPDSDLVFKSLSMREFNTEMHRLYLEVFQRSKGKLEKLPEDFFRNLPDDFQLLACYSQGKVIGWNIALQDHELFYFFLGGIDYQYNKQHSTYFRLLTALVKKGIESGARQIDLGQTAEIPKMRMGGKPVPLFMQASHSNPFLNYLLCRFSGLLEYRMKSKVPEVLKEVGEDATKSREIMGNVSENSSPGPSPKEKSAGLR